MTGATAQEQVVTAADPAAALTDLPLGRRRAVFFGLPASVQATVVASMDEAALTRFVRQLDPDEATDVLGLADESAREAVLAALSADRREKVEFLLGFSPESAAGMMDLNYVTVDRDRSIAEIADRVTRFEDRTGRFPTVIVTDDDGVLGELPGHTLARTDPDGAALTDYLRDMPSIRYDRSEEAVRDVFRANPERKIAVLDEDDAVLGVIYAEHILQAIDDAAGETLYEFTGVAEAESVLDGPLSKVQHRYKWLILNLGTAFLAALTVGVFEDTIQAFTLLAVYMPIVAGMGGNAGTQAMAITVRGLTLEQVSLATGWRTIRNEVLAGAVNGTITGVLVALVAIFVDKEPLLGAVLAVSMVLNLVIAGFFGAIIPLVLDRQGIDPATSATIFITTATDVLGFFVFLGLATMVI